MEAEGVGKNMGNNLYCGFYNKKWVRRSKEV